MISSAFGNAGQRCLAGSVAVGVGSLGQALVDELVDQTSKLKVGPGTEPDTDMGPVVREERRKELVGYIDHGEEEGAKLVADGRGSGARNGFLMAPTIFDGLR